MTKEEFNSVRINTKKIWIKYLIGFVIFVVLYVGLIYLFDKVLDYFYPLRSEDNPISFTIYLFSMLIMLSPLYIGIKLMTTKLNRAYEYYSTLRAIQPKHYDVSNITESNIVSRLCAKGYVETKSFFSTNTLVRRFEKHKKMKVIDCVLLLRPDHFGMDDFEQLLKDFDEKTFSKMTCKIFVVTNSSSDEVKNAFAFEINISSVPLHVTLYDIEEHRFYFKLPYNLNQNTLSPVISDYRFIYDLFMGIPYKDVRKSNKQKDSI